MDKKYCNLSIDNDLNPKYNYIKKIVGDKQPFMFKKITQERIPYLIARQIRDLILAGKLVPGDKLPPEKDLLKQLNVSRQTLREALRVLEAIGLIEVRKGAGGGAVIVKMGSEKLCETISNFLFFRNVSLSNLGEIRKVLEPYFSKIAAERLGPEELDELRALNQECEEMIANGEDIVGGRGEIEFHATIAGISGNPVIEMIQDFVTVLLVEMKIELKPGLEFSRKVLNAHKRILKAFEKKDGDAAAREMYRHVSEVDEMLQDIVQKN